MHALADLVAVSTTAASTALAQAITTNPEQHADELITQLDRIWRKERAEHDADDRLWLAAVACIPAGLLTQLQNHARCTERYPAARCLAHHAA